MSSGYEMFFIRIEPKQRIEHAPLSMELPLWPQFQ
jgi:hypothetical protein